MTDHDSGIDPRVADAQQFTFERYTADAE